MTFPDPHSPHRVLLVDDDDAVRDMMTMTLKHKGFDVTAASNVTEAWRFITTESFDVLITDLYMPNPSDGFTVVTAMRHSQPNALTLLVSGYPDIQDAISAILLEADEIIVKPSKSESSPTFFARRCLLVNPLHAWKNRGWPRSCSVVWRALSKTGLPGQNRRKN